MARHARDTRVTCRTVLQLSFLKVHRLLSMACVGIMQAKSAIVDFERMNIQNLEEMKVLLRFGRKTGQIHRPVRHAEACPEVL